MKLVGRIIVSLLAAAFSYFLYIFLPTYLVENFGDLSIPFPSIVIEKPDFDQLIFYIGSLGYIIVGLSFAQNMAADKSKIKPIWHLLRVFMKIIFLGALIYVNISIINVSVALAVGQSLALGIDITILFWGMMGGVIFDIITTVLDFLIAFIPEKEKTSEKAESEDTAMEALV
jgi:hypothetical protein